MEIDIGPVTITTSFQVIDVPTSFNLLLGRPWIHQLKAIPSSLHQKVKFPCDGKIITIKGDDYSAYKKVKDQPLYEVNPERVGFELSGFEYDTIQYIEGTTSKAPIIPYGFGTFSIYCPTRMLMNTFYLPGMNMAKSGKKTWSVQAWELPTNSGTFGLGYEPTNEELSNTRKVRRKNGKPKPLRINSMNGIFCKEGEQVPYHGFNEGVYSITAKKRQPGFEIFTDVFWAKEDKSLDNQEMEEFM